MAKKCWLIVERHGEPAVIASHFAKLRRLHVQLIQRADETFPELGPPPESLVVASAVLLENLTQSGWLHLRVFLSKGGTLYLQGGFEEGKIYPSVKSARLDLRVGKKLRTEYFHIRYNSLLPKALQGELFKAELLSVGAHVEHGEYEELVSSSFEDGETLPVLLAQRVGAGLVIYDLTPPISDTANQKPLTERLAVPAERACCLGALTAVDSVALRENRLTSAINLVIDDRPANFDYFNTFSLRRLLSHLESFFPGIHIDFGWVPSQDSPSRRYVETMKAFNVGFVWHGFARHVDHRTIKDLRSELESGRRLVEKIAARYQVKFQPVMIFPFERSDPSAKRLLEDFGFIACAEHPQNSNVADKSIAGYLYGCLSGTPSPSGNFITLYRYPVEYFTRDLMLARAALGLPIIAAAHPGDVALRRLSPLRRNCGTISHFDGILRFAAQKGLRPLSLEEIAHESLEGYSGSGPRRQTLIKGLS